MGRVITSPGVLKNVQGQIDHVTDMYDDIKDNNLKPLTVTLDPVSNANGAYSHTTEDERITEDMKAVTLEVGTPECFRAPVTVSTANGSATVQCADAHGNSTITVTFVKTSPVTGGADYPPAVTSTEFDILADRIGALTDLDTTDKSSIVNAVNEVIDNVSDVNSKIANVINVGQFSASGSGVENKITDSISKVTTGGVTVNFTANPSSSGIAYVSGFLYPNKDYGGGYYIDTYREAYWYLNNGTLTIIDLNSNISSSDINGTISNGTNTITVKKTSFVIYVFRGNTGKFYVGFCSDGYITMPSSLRSDDDVSMSISGATLTITSSYQYDLRYRIIAA